MILDPLSHGKRRAVPSNQGSNSLALATVIIVAIATLLDLAAFRKSWCYKKPIVFALVVTFSAVLMFGVEVGSESPPTGSLAD